VPAQRDFDIVVFGATGFTGELTAAYLAEHAPAECRWALAGRNQAKLEEVRTRLAALDPGCAGLPLLHADAGDADSLRAVAESTKVVISTVQRLYARLRGELVDVRFRPKADILNGGTLSRQCNSLGLDAFARAKCLPTQSLPGLLASPGDA